MTATLYQERGIKNKCYKAITAEDNWKDVINNWLLAKDIPHLPRGRYLIVQDDVIAEFRLDTIDSGERFIELVKYLSLDNIYSGGNN